MIIGTGIDITLISRMEKSVKNEAFMKKVFTADERAYIASKGQRAQTAAGMFCAKEALMKAYGKGLGELPLQTLEVLHEASGKPYFQNGNGERIHLSISHMGDIAVAQVIVESEEK